MSENVLQSAVRELRQRLGKTQTEFGQMLKKALPTIQRWEGVVPPAGSALADLAVLAREQRLDEYAQIFEAALGRELFKTQFSAAVEEQGGPVDSYIVRWLETNEEREYGRYFHRHMNDLRSSDKEVQDKARAILQPLVPEGRRSRGKK